MALTGIHVVEVAQGIAGPYNRAKLLADMGAEGIKIVSLCSLRLSCQLSPSMMLQQCHEKPW